jgi:hypothetical protein
MAKLILTICWVATSQCQSVPWTGNFNLSGDPLIYSAGPECANWGWHLTHSHGGHAYVGHPDYDIKSFKCVPE